MDKKIRILGIAAAVAAMIIIITSPSGLVIPQPTTSRVGTEAVQILATNLQKPWAITSGEHKIFFTEKIGRIRVIDNGTLVNQSVADLRVADITDAGLLGITLDPDYKNDHYIYVYYTYKDGNNLWNKVIRITESNNRIVDTKTILDKIPAAEFDDGGVIKFGPDKKLYIGTGDATDQSLSQNMTSLGGKILRVNSDGSIPQDNPFPNSKVYSYGHRNPQGLAWDDMGNMYETEEGPTRNDKINLIKAGQNYGWPSQECSGSTKSQAALICYNPSIEPAGITYYMPGKLDLKESVIVATLRGNALYQLPLQNGTIAAQKIILDGIGRIRDVNEASDGYLYIVTSNTDGRGFPDQNDDKLLRVVK